MSVRALGGGRHEIGVHIADVAWFVREGGALDREAATRSTTVYLPDRRLDMLPPLLSADLCSLRAQRDRYCVSVVWVVDEGREWRREPGSTWVGRTLVRSAHSLAYEQAEALVSGRGAEVATRDGPAGPGLVATGDPVPAGSVAAITDALHVLSAAATAMRARRTRAGALSLATAEIEFAIEAGDGDAVTPTGIRAHTHLPVHEMVGDLMIAANEMVARVIAAVHPRAAILRGHPPPAEDSLRHMAEVATAAGLAPPPRLADARPAGTGGGAHSGPSPPHDPEVGTGAPLSWPAPRRPPAHAAPAHPPAPGPLARGGRDGRPRAHHRATRPAHRCGALSASGPLLCTRVRAGCTSPHPTPRVGPLEVTHSPCPPARCRARRRAQRQAAGRHCTSSRQTPRGGPAAPGWRGTRRPSPAPACATTASASPSTRTSRPQSGGTRTCWPTASCSWP